MAFATGFGGAATEALQLPAHGKVQLE